MIQPRMRRAVTAFGMLVLSLVPAVALAPRARAWATDGHEIVAELAESFIAPQTRTELAKLLPDGKGLASIANWADDYRKSCSNTGPWHYVNIPLEAPSFVSERDCIDPPGCVVDATERALAILSDPQSPLEDRSLALRLTVHFIGDLHQPLHSGDRADHGGNDLHLQFADHNSNLHRVWDYELIHWTGRSVLDYVAMLARSLKPAEARRWKRGGVRDWVIEAQRAARRAYAKLPKRAGPIELGDAYANAMLHTLDEQLLRAGVRLAAALDAALARPGPPATDQQLTAARECVGPVPRTN
jgi:hypothetical protein